MKTTAAGLLLFIAASVQTSAALNLAKFPRRVYTNYQTPIEPMPRLSDALGGKVNLWIKRDDQLGLAGGGNKTRKLEFVIADALKKGADTIVTCGAVQSNHCRLTLAACVKEGLKCSMVIEERVPDSYKENASGNNYLFNLMGVENTKVVGLGEAPAGMEEMAEELRKQGRNVYVVPGGASNEIGSLGYCSCGVEIQSQQFKDQLPAFDTLVTASGSGGTHSGLVTGLDSIGSSIDIVGISTRQPKEQQEAHIHELATKVANYAGVPPPKREKVVVYDDYVGEGYSLPTRGMEEAVTLFAQEEGILLDPVYSGKAAAGLVDLVRKGKFAEGSNVLFLHTGGAPSLYHYQPLYKEEAKSEEPEPMMEMQVNGQP